MPVFWTLVSDIPIGLKIWDLGGGIDSNAQGSQVTADQITSLPLRALWEGVSLPGMWNTEPVQVDFRGLMSSLTRNLGEGTSSAATLGFNLAVVNETYLNLHLRLGYHYNLVDARMDPEPHHNHIYFRFVGGVTDLTRRSRRARLLADILSQYHFKVDVKGDLVLARILHLPQEEVRRRLVALGQLVGLTRQLDMLLKTDEDVPHFFSEFLRRLDGHEDKPFQEDNMAQNKLKILILDDEPIVCKRLKPSLEKHGFQVDTFTRSFEALQAVKEAGYDIIITDLKMEGMDGMRFLQEAKNLNPKTEVIVITGFATMETAKESFKKGVFDFIAKPFNLSEIQRVVMRAEAKIRGTAQ